MNKIQEMKLGIEEVIKMGEELIQETTSKSNIKKIRGCNRRLKFIHNMLDLLK